MEKIRLLIVDDIAQTRTDLRRLLYFEEDLDVVGEASNGEEALSLVADLMPDIVLMDINMPVMDGITATEKMSHDFPEVSVVMISIQGEQEYLKKAMVAGARDYLVKPVNSEEIAATLRQVYTLDKARVKQFQSRESMEEPPIKDRIITFFSGKGGTGKSVLAANLAVSLAQQGKEVVLIDLDLQFGDLSLLFNISDIKCISDLVEEPEGIDEHNLPRYLLPHNSWVQIISACYSPQDAEKVKEKHLIDILDLLEQKFDCIIIDTPCAFNDLTLFALERANLIMLPVLCDLANIKNAKTVVNILNTLDYLNKIRLILNMEDLAFGVDKEDMEKSLELKVFHTIPWDEKNVGLSINKGVPFVLMKNSVEVGRSLEKLSEKISPLRKSMAQNGEQPKKERKNILGVNLFNL